MSPILYCKIQDQSLNLHDIYLVYMSIVIRFSVLIYVIICCSVMFFGLQRLFSRTLWILWLQVVGRNFQPQDLHGKLVGAF